MACLVLLLLFFPRHCSMSRRVQSYTYLWLLYEQKRRNVLDMRSALEDVKDKGAAHNWVETFAESMVCDCSLAAIGVLTCVE